MGGRSQGYEYCYNFWTEDDIIPLYSTELFGIRYVGSKGFLLEIRTNFKLKRIYDDDTMLLGSERFGTSVVENNGRYYNFWFLEQHTKMRLKDYWMSDKEVKSLVHNALAFAQQRAMADQSFSVIPVVVGLDVWTVQQETESINAVIDRAIKPESLFPLHLCYVGLMDSYQDIVDNYGARDGFMMDLPRIRVEDEAGFMELCPVCSRNYSIGAQISFFPCNHACHSLCVFQWLEKRNSSCPVCKFRIPTDLERLDGVFTDSDEEE